MSLDKAQPSPHGSRLGPRPFINHRNEIERQIIVKLVEDLLASGAQIQVNDGEEDVTEFTADAAQIFAAMSSTDMERLFVRRNTGRDAFKLGWVLLIYGNDADVISDYTIDLEPLLVGAEAIAESFQR